MNPHGMTLWGSYLRAKTHCNCMAYTRMYRSYGSGYRIDVVFILNIIIMLKTILCLLSISIIVCATYIFTPRPFVVHYHANFAAYIDGKKWDFSPSTYMEEVSRCNVTEGVMPEDRIHLHDNKG